MPKSNNEGFTTKNGPKGESYSFAFKRINHAIEEEFYLEAITLCESIISDRLLSYVNFHRAKPLAEKEGLGKLTRELSRLTHGSVQWKDSDLIVRLDEWRDKRNLLVHGAAKSLPGTPTMPVDEFQFIAKETAKKGKSLARDMCRWHANSKKP
jgi:hypothetical protein